MAARGLTRSLVAAKETVASTRTIGNMAEAFVMNIMQRGNDGALDRVLDAPTNEAWIRPWVRHAEAHRRALPHGPGGRRARRRPGRADRRRHRPRPARPAPARRGRLVRLGDARRARAQAAVAQAPRARPGPRADPRALHRLDGRDPVLPAQAGRHHPRPRHVRRRAVGADRAHPGPVLGRARLRRRLRRRQGGRLPLGRHLRLGHAGDPLRQAREAVHQAADQARGLGADQGPPRGPRRRPICPTASSTPGFLDPGVRWNRARKPQHATQTPLLVNTVGSWDEAPERPHEGPEPVPRRRLRAERHRPGDDGGRERDRARRRRRPARRGRARRPSRRRCTSSTTRRSSRPPRRSTASCTGRACRTRSTLADRAREHADAVIVGARCAGSAAAIALARAGRRVVALDRARFPSDTLSTHLLWAGGVAELKRLGALERVEALGAPRLPEALAGWSGHEIRGGYTPGRRDRLRALRPASGPRRGARRDRARGRGRRAREVHGHGGCVRDDGRVAGVRYRDPDGDERELRAPLVVGADGRRSLVGREVGAEPPVAGERERPRLLLRLLARRPARVARDRRAVAVGGGARHRLPLRRRACCSSC